MNSYIIENAIMEQVMKMSRFQINNEEYEAIKAAEKGTKRRRTDMHCP